jgi:electron-transferring-flavoprotein dehydrogenase
LSPFDEFKRYKTHPVLQAQLRDGERLSYGARTLTGGGVQSLPKLTFPGGALVGDAAGMVNSPRMQGIHTSMKSAMLAAEAAVNALVQHRAHDTLHEYDTALHASWVYDELHAVRNVKPCLRYGFVGGLLGAGFHLWAQQVGAKLPWTLQHTLPDHQTLCPAAEMPVLNYPPYDNITTFDRASSVYLSHTQHEEDQPYHLHLNNAELPERFNLPRYGGPERLYCPAGVFEYRSNGDTPGAPLTLRIHAVNCLHCKACDLKDPTLNITWTPPEGGSGPHYVI